MHLTKRSLLRLLIYSCLVVMVCVLIQQKEEGNKDVDDKSTPISEKAAIKSQSITDSCNLIEDIYCKNDQATSENQMMPPVLLSQKPINNELLKPLAIKNVSEIRNKAGFFENRGQYKESEIQYVLNRHGMKMLLKSNSLAYYLNYQRSTDSGTEHLIDVIDVTFEGANTHPEILTFGESQDKHNYFLGETKATGVSHFRQVVYKDLYPGIDLLFEAFGPEASKFGAKYSFIVHPGADPDQIKVKYDGHKGLNTQQGLTDGNDLNTKDVLNIGTSGGAIGEHLTDIYTVDDADQLQMVSGEFHLEDGLVTYELGEYDREQTLVIDPEVVTLTLRKSTYYGSSDKEQLKAVDSDANGNIFTVGVTESVQEFLLSKNGFQNNPNGGNEILVGKFSQDLSSLISATYLGGESDDQAFDLVVDLNGNVNLTGYTTSADFPGVVNTYQYKERTDIIIVQLNNTLSELNWTNGIGGTGSERGNSITVSDNFLYVGGTTGSADLNTIGEDFNGRSSEALLLKYNLDDGGLVWSRYNNDSRSAEGSGVVVYGNNVLFGGKFSESTSDRVFISKYNANGTLLDRKAFATALIDNVNGIALSQNEEFVAIVGSISGEAGFNDAGLENTKHQRNYGGGGTDGFIIQVSVTDLSVDWSSYYGNVGDDPERRDEMLAVTYDCNGNLIATGYTTSPRGISENGYINTYQGGAQGENDFGDAFMVKFDQDGVRYWGSYFGAAANEAGQGIALSKTGDILLCGVTTSVNGIATEGTFDDDKNQNDKDADEGFLSTFCDILITQTPTDKTVSYGGNVTFSVEIDYCGEENASYSWTGPKGSVGGNSNTLDLQGVTEADAGEYCVKVTTSCGSEEVCADLTIVSLSGNNVCLSPDTQTGAPASDQELMTLQFPDIRINDENGAPIITDIEYKWSVSPATGANRVVDPNDRSLLFTLDMSDFLPDLRTINIAPEEPGTYTYTLEINYNDSRQDPPAVSDATEVQVTVFDHPTLTDLSDVVMCENEAPSITINSDINLSSLEWELTDDAGGNISIVGGNSDTETGLSGSSFDFTEVFRLDPGVTTSANGTLVFTPTSVNGCEGDAIGVNVTVKAQADLEVNDNGASLYCSGDEIQVNFSAPGFNSTTFSWLRAEQTGITPSTGSASGLSEGSIRETLNNTSNSRQNVNYAITGSFNDCDNQVSQQITILPETTVSTIDDEVICSGQPFSTNITTTISDTDAVGYDITYSNNDQVTGASDLLDEEGYDSNTAFSFSQTLTNTSNVDQVVTYTVTPYQMDNDGNKCTGSPENFDVTVRPVADIKVSDIEVCSGEELSLPITSNVNGAVINYVFDDVTAIDYSGESTGTIGNGELTGRFTITDENIVSPIIVQIDLTAQYQSCTGEFQSVNVTINPVPNVSIDGVSTICGGSPADITATSHLSNVTWQWFDDNDQEISGATTATLNPAQPGTYRAVATHSTSGCIGANIIEITQPEVVDFDATLQSSGTGNDCASDGIDLSVLINSGSPDFQWQQEIGGSFQDIAGENTESYSVTQNGVYRVVINPGTDCEEFTDPYNVQFSPLPDISLSLDNPNVCPEDQITLQGSISENGAVIKSVNWSYDPQTTPIVIDDTDSLAPILTFSAYNGDQPINYVVTMEVVTEDDCRESALLDVILQPLPIAVFDLPDIHCRGSIEERPTNNSQRAIGYNWQVFQGTVDLTAEVIPNNTEEEPLIFFPENNTDNDIIYTVRLTANSSFCEESVEQAVTVKPQPEMVVDGIEEVCNGATLNLSAANSQTKDGAEFQEIIWLIDGAEEANGESASPVLENLGTEVISYDLQVVGITQNNCADTLFAELIVNPDARADFGVTSEVGCAPFNIVADGQLTDAENFPDANGAYVWNYYLDGSATPILTQSGISPPEYELTDPDQSLRVELVVDALRGCGADTFERTFSTLSNPVPDFNIPAEACSGNPVNIIDQSLLTNGLDIPDDAIYSWDFGDGQVSNEESPIHIFNNPSATVAQAYDVTLSIELGGGCVKQIQKSINVLPAPLAAYETSSSCSGGTIQLNNTSFGNGLVYQWSEPSGNVEFDDNTALNPVITLPENQSDQTFDITLLVTSDDNCTDEFTRSLVVFGDPYAEIDVNELLCRNTTIAFNSVEPTVSSQLAPDSLYIWYFGDNDPDTVRAPNRTGTFVFPDTGRFEVVLEVVNTGGCTDLDTINVRVIDQPQALFEKTIKSFDQQGGNLLDSIVGPDNDKICGPYVTLNVENLSFDYGVGETYEWDFGRGTNDIVQGKEPGEIIFAQNNFKDTTYQISLTVTNQCGSHVYEDEVIIIPSPQADFTFSWQYGCDEVPVEIINNSIGVPETYYYDFGDGVTMVTNDSQPIEYVFDNTGTEDTTYTVQLVAENQCGIDTVTRVLSIIPNDIRASASIAANDNYFCVGEEIVVNANGINPENSDITWTISDGRLFLDETEISVAFDQEGEYDIFLDVFVPLCDNEAKDTIHVVVQSGPDIDFELKSPICVGESVSIDNTGAIFSEVTLWDFGDGNLIKGSLPSGISYDSAGTYEVKMSLKGANNCQTEVIKMIEVIDPPQVNFEMPGLVCQGSRIQFTNLTQGAKSYRWYIEELRDTTVADSFSRVFTDVGIYHIVLEAYTDLSQEGCMSSISKSFSVENSPGVRLEVVKDTVCEHEYTSVVEFASDAIVNHWYLVDFGGTDTLVQIGSTDPGDSLTFRADWPGTLNVLLESVGASGCKSYGKDTLVVWPEIPILVDTVGVNSCMGKRYSFENRTNIPDSIDATFSWYRDGDPLGDVWVPLDQPFAGEEFVNSNSIIEVDLSYKKCNYKEEIEIMIPGVLPCEYILPKVFTPNNDGFNDDAEVLIHQNVRPNVLEINMKVFNLSENMIHEVVMKRDSVSQDMRCISGCEQFDSENWHESVIWDGMVGGSPADRGAYMVQVGIRCCTDDSPQSSTSYIQLIK